MAVRKLQLKPQIYDFQIPEPYTYSNLLTDTS